MGSNVWANTAILHNLLTFFLKMMAYRHADKELGWVPSKRNKVTTIFEAVPNVDDNCFSEDCFSLNWLSHLNGFVHYWIYSHEPQRKCLILISANWLFINNPLWMWKGKVKVVQSCLTLWLHWLYIHGILQARILEWVTLPFSGGSSQPRDQTQVSHIAGRFFSISIFTLVSIHMILLGFTSLWDRIWTLFKEVD